MKFAITFALVATAITVKAASVAELLADIKIIGNGINSVNNQVQAYPTTGGTIAAALTIHTSFAGLVTPINIAASDSVALAPLPLAVADATSILDALDLFTPVASAKLQKLLALRATFGTLPYNAVLSLKIDLTNVNAARNAFENALIQKLPTAALVTRATAFRNNLNAQFAPVIAAYS